VSSFIINIGFILLIFKDFIFFCINFFHYLEKLILFFYFSFYQSKGHCYSSLIFLIQECPSLTVPITSHVLMSIVVFTTIIISIHFKGSRSLVSSMRSLMKCSFTLKLKKLLRLLVISVSYVSILILIVVSHILVCPSPVAKFSSKRSNRWKKQPRKNNLILR
jgi:hypothetical protein